MLRDSGSRVIRFGDPATFARVVEPFLAEHEAANNLPLGISGYLAAHPEEDSSGYYLAVVELDDAIGAVAIHTPGFNIVLSFPDSPESTVLFVDDLHERAWPLPGVLGPTRAVEAFAARWAALTGASMRDGTPQLIYALSEVRRPGGVPGRIRPADATDLAFLVESIRGFARDAEGEDLSVGVAVMRVEGWAGDPDTAVFVWEHEGPVSMALARGRTPHGIRISGVYTTPEHRRRGYASACVAALSERMLDEGRRFCFLFTDARNPTSNAIYQAIGYELVTEVRQLRFEPSAAVEGVRS